MPAILILIFLIISVAFAWCFASKVSKLPVKTYTVHLLQDGKEPLDYRNAMCPEADASYIRFYTHGRLVYWNGSFKLEENP